MEDKRSFSRRSFLKLAGAITVASTMPNTQGLKPVCPSKAKRTLNYLDDNKLKSVFTTCLGCNARCGLRCLILDGQIKEVYGNPYHPYNTLGNPVSYHTSFKEAVKIKASTCGKAQEINGYCHNKRRILVPLKRVGKRGEGKFEPISWQKLIDEISQGGKLFQHLGEDRMVPGLKDLLKDEPIDKDAPELGPIRNKFCFLTGRLQSGRKEFIDRFVKYSFGSINRIGHTDICGLGFRMGNFAFTNGKEVELKADPWNAKYILIFGANIYEALQPGLNTYGATLANRYSKGQVKFVIVDPRAQKAGCHAHRWVKIMPGQDGAFALGMIRWMIENKKFNKKYLEAPNEQAARDIGNNGYVNATHLVIWQKGHPLHGTFLKINGEYAVLEKNIKRLLSYKKAYKAELFVDTYITTENGENFRVKSAFQILKEEAFRYSLEEYANFCGIEKEDIIEVAKEFYENAPFSATCQYHGAGNYVNGTYSAYAIAVLNALSGSIGRKGGYLSSSKGAGNWGKGNYNLIDFTGKRTPQGIKISREKASYQESSFFKKRLSAGQNPYPAKRPWFPFTKGGLCVEALSGIDEGYPYNIDVLFLYFFNPVYSIPGGSRFINTLKDTQKVPLLVSIDIGINESNIYADYIIPDITYAEGQYGWLSPHAPAFKFTSFRCPLIEPLTEKTDDGRAICLETFLIDLAKKLNLPGFGKDAIPILSNKKKSNNQYSALDRAEDFYLRAYSNICQNAGLNEVSHEAVRFVEENYLVAKFKNALTQDEWQKLCYALSKGGIFYPYEEAFEDNIFKFGPNEFFIYNETLSNTTCSITGKPFHGGPKYVPPIYKLTHTYPFVLVSYKDALHTQSRTVWHEIALEIQPENYVFIHPRDAKLLGVKDLDKVSISSMWNKQAITGRVKITKKVRPNVAAISISYGHKALGANEIFIKDCKRAIGGGDAICKDDVMMADKRLGAGINPNELSALDIRFNNTPLVDLVGGIPDFSSTCINIRKIDT